ncbi:MAG: PAS domain-containing protein [Amaricoccus sp.]|nr:PAS domain-containing protein [Amaricoccus sp.]
MPEGAALGILARAPLSMILTDPRLPDNPIVYVNRAFEKTTGYPPSAAIGRNCRFLQGEGTDPRSVARLREAVAEGREISLDILNYRADGAPFWNRLVIAPLLDPQGKVQYFAGIQQVLGEPLEETAGEQVDRAVREVQHRVKNHLSLIVSMIRMQARGAEDDSALEMLAHRVESLKLLYDELTYRGGENRDAVALGPYLGRVAAAIAALDDRPEVSVEVGFDSFAAPMEVAVNLGLVLSELVTNALRHAFAGRGGVVRVGVREGADGGVVVVVADDGGGMPAGAALPAGGGLGGRIVAALVRSLDATLEVESGPGGSTFTIAVPRARRFPI